MTYKTKLLSILNSKGKRIYLLYDFVPEEERPLIIVPCQFEKSMRDNVSISMYLAGNGFNVLRYDSTNHVGISEGEHLYHTSSGAYDDFHDVFTYARSGAFQYSSIGVLGISLTARILFKYFSANSAEDVGLFVSLVGVVNLDRTLENITGEDIVKGNLEGTVYGVKKIIKYPINWNLYLNDASENQYTGIDKTIEEIGNIKVPMVVICAEKDEWVDVDDYYRVFDNDFECVKEKFLIPDAAHKLSKNPEAAEQALFQVIKSFSKYLKGTDLENEMIYKPIITEIIDRNKQERRIEMEMVQKSITGNIDKGVIHIE